MNEFYVGTLGALVRATATQRSGNKLVWFPDPSLFNRMREGEGRVWANARAKAGMREKVLECNYNPQRPVITACYGEIRIQSMSRSEIEAAID